MALRCLLFSSDDGTAQSIRQVLADLRIEGEYCPVAGDAAERVRGQHFHLVVVDWDDQPEAGSVLQAARERKAAERPLTLAIVKDDGSVPQALQAGANSILRKPILPDQARDTLTKARDLLKAKLEPAPMAKAAAASLSSGAASPPASSSEVKQTLGREVPPRVSPSPDARFDGEAATRKASDEAATTHVDSPKGRESLAGPVEDNTAVSAERPYRSTEEPRGLAWYMKGRAGTLALPPTPPPMPAQPELLGYSGMSASGETAPAINSNAAPPAPPTPEQRAAQEQKTEAELFAYMDGEATENSKPLTAKARPWLRKVVLMGALILSCGTCYLIVPRSLWLQNVRIVLAYVARISHGWLNPQLVTPVQAPVSHENFGRAGDEYKLPVVENIPDATTDPSQIRVVPIIDPTAKQPNGGTNTSQTAGTENSNPTGETNSIDPSASNEPQSSAVGVQENQPAQPAPATSDPGGSQLQGSPAQPAVSGSSEESAHSDPFGAPSDKPPAPVIVRPSVRPYAPKSSPPAHTSVATASGIPSSLRSQMASSTEAGGNKPADAAMPSIEPVDLPEATARSLLLEQPEPSYPETAKGKHGTVILQVLVGRDGTVQDAKFLQGSLVFARVAIDAVKQWRFKSYTMNGRPVSTQTRLTLTFKPAS